MKNAFAASTLTRPDVQRLNSAFAWVCALLAVALPLAVFYQLVTTPTEGLLLRSGVSLSTLQVAVLEVELWQRVLAVALGMVPVFCASYGLVCAMRCFSGFSQSEYFSLRNVRYLRGFAAGVFASVVAGFFVAMAISVLLTLGAPAGQRALAMGLGSNELLTLLFAGMVWQIAAVMAKAVALAEENAQFV
ncbi:MAG: DUF2975 domain-containing protein [Polaromonas sp.]|uniref:DUF2975 domain-containing protein n=1 Tax=Polaromonas sp. TaxID=1869339 RepID=UPI002731DEDC|nr:DUF2975 domain-containing protein [Polaromonas sp.]MDP1739502.1 DUF2975 domain-containing protein [Polaromonas sp.]MDP1956387.1 DUF2975 domain-containing protein [Polaromonas sp.]MDP3355351.1 DUF2975 domain-containing protein [Polaromonas sp.]MDP3750321.1 DUF2975 domain-containing protein [Polaromonas sp.]